MGAVTASNVIDGFFKTKVLHEIKLVTNPCSENQGTKLSGRSYKTSICISQGRQWKRIDLIIVFGAEGTLLKEFEKNKIGNIRLRAVPVEDWVATWLISFTKSGSYFSKIFNFQKNNQRISIHQHKK